MRPAPRIALLALACALCSASPALAQSEPVPRGVLNLSPATIAFGDVFAGSTSPTREMKVTASEAPVKITTVSLLHPSSSQFIVGGNCTGAFLYIGWFCKIQLAFKPTHSGPVKGSLRVSGANARSVTGTLTGTGLPGGPNDPMVDPRPDAKRQMEALVRAIPRLVRGGPGAARTLPGFATKTGYKLELRLTGRVRGKSVVLAGGKAYLKRGVTSRLRFRLNRTGRRYLRAKRAKVRVSLTYTWYGERRAAVTKTVTVRR